MFTYIVCYHYRYIFTENTVEPKKPVLKTKLILGHLSPQQIITVIVRKEISAQ